MVPSRDSPLLRALTSLKWSFPDGGNDNLREVTECTRPLRFAGMRDYRLGHERLRQCADLPGPRCRRANHAHAISRSLPRTSAGPTCRAFRLSGPCHQSALHELDAGGHRQTPRPHGGSLVHRASAGADFRSRGPRHRSTFSRIGTSNPPPKIPSKISPRSTSRHASAAESWRCASRPSTSKRHARPSAGAQ